MVEGTSVLLTNVLWEVFQGLIGLYLEAFCNVSIYLYKLLWKHFVLKDSLQTTRRVRILHYHLAALIWRKAITVINMSNKTNKLCWDFRISSGCHWFPTGGHCGRKERWYAWGKIKVLSEICSSIAFFFRLRECSWRPGAAVMRCMHCSYSLPYSHRKLLRWGKKFPELSVLVKEAAVLILIPSILLQTEMLQNSSEEQKRKTYTSVWHS